MTAKIRFMYDNLWDLDTSVLAASSEAAGFPAENTQHIWHTRHWRSTDVTAEYLKINIGTPLTDGEFENWTGANLDSWDKDEVGGSTVNKEVVEIHGGAASVRLDVDAPNNAVDIWQEVTLVSQRKYKISLWYKNSAVGKTAKILLYDTGSNIYLDENGEWQESAQEIILPNSTSWTKYEITFITHKDYESYFIALWRHSAASSSIYFDDCHLTPAFDVLIIKYHNVRPGIGSVYIQGNYEDAWVGTPLDDALDVKREIIVYFPDNTENYDWYRINLYDPGNPDGYLRVGRVYLGTFLEPGWAHFHPLIKQHIDPSIKRYSTGGQISVCKRESYIRIPWNFPWIKTADIPGFKIMWDFVGQSTPYFICETPDENPHLNTYYLINLAPWDFETLYTKGKLLIDTETMR